MTQEDLSNKHNNCDSLADENTLNKKKHFNRSRKGGRLENFNYLHFVQILSKSCELLLEQHNLYSLNNQLIARYNHLFLSVSSLQTCFVKFYLERAVLFIPFILKD